MRDPLRVGAEQLTDHADALGELDEDDDDRELPAGHRRVVVHDVAVDLAGPGGDVVLGPGEAAHRAHRARRVAQRAAAAAALDAQLVAGGALPEEGGVRRDHRPQHVAAAAPPRGRGSGRFRRRRGGRNFRIRNIIDATASVPTYQVLRVVTNQPSPSAVRFGPGHPLQAGAHRDLLAGAQIAVVLLLAVGGDDGGEPGFVQRGRTSGPAGRRDPRRRPGAGRASSRPASSPAVPRDRRAPTARPRRRRCRPGWCRPSPAPSAGSWAGSPGPAPRAARSRRAPRSGRRPA